MTIPPHISTSTRPNYPTQFPILHSNQTVWAVVAVAKLYEHHDDNDIHDTWHPTH
jgi:hypothetical protein